MNNLTQSQIDSASFRSEMFLCTSFDSAPSLLNPCFLGFEGTNGVSKRSPWHIFFDTRYLLHHRFCTRKLLHRIPFTTFCTKQLLRQVPFAPDTFHTHQFLHQKFFRPSSLRGHLSLQKFYQLCMRANLFFRSQCLVADGAMLPWRTQTFSGLFLTALRRWPYRGQRTSVLEWHFFRWHSIATGDVGVHLLIDAY